ncbi:MAG: alginate export family protein [Pseudomonadota bacterium]|nr:alginate export family protein [Pseudomonadota bacterium]
MLLLGLAHAAPPLPFELRPFGRVFFRPELTQNLSDYDSDAADIGFVFALRGNLGVAASLPLDVDVVVDLNSYGLYALLLDAGPLDPEVRLYRGYVEARDLGNTPLDLRVGRAEVGTYGTGMLLSTDDFNDGFSLEGLRLRWDTDRVVLDIMWNQLYADLTPAPDATVEEWGHPVLVGTHNTVRVSPGLSVDAYFWWMVYRPFAGYRATQTYVPGLRASGAGAGFDYSVEGTLQMGSAAGFNGTEADADAEVAAGNQDALFAYAVEPRVGYTLGRVRLGARYYRASGDADATDEKVGTFNHMWQDPHGRFGNLDHFVGSNIQFEGVEATWRLADGARASSLRSTAYALQAVEPGDNAHGAFDVAPATDAGTALGVGADVSYRYLYSENLSFEFNVSAFQPGRYVTSTVGTGDTMFRAYIYMDAPF